MNEAFKNAIGFISQNTPPIWFMRQAGRYQKSYRKLREKYSFTTICKTAELAAATAIAPIKEFDFDVAILFSDILFPLETLGLDYPESAPVLQHQIKSSADLKLLNEPDLSFQIDALKETKRLLPNNKSLIGFIGGPFTLFCFANRDPHHLLKNEINLALFSEFSKIIIPILRKQIKTQLEAGAELVVIFDSFAALLPANYDYLSIINELICENPDKILYFSKEATPFYQNPSTGLALGHQENLIDYLNKPHKVIQGNFDERLLLLPKHGLKDALLLYLKKIKELPLETRAGWIMSLGHGVPKDTPEDNVKLVVNTVREFL